MKNLAFLLLLTAGCSVLHSVQNETALDGSKRRTSIWAGTFMDAEGKLTKYKSLTSDKSQVISIGEASAITSGSNVTAIAGAIAEGVTKGVIGKP